VRALWRAARAAPITCALMGLSLLVFAYQASLSAADQEQFMLRWSAVPMEIVEQIDLPPTVPFPIAGTLLTALLIHAGWAHLAGNMLLLGLFGLPAERALGGRRALGLYLAGGVLGGLAQLAANPLSLTGLVGASGAIAALIGADLRLGGSLARRMVAVGWITAQLLAAADQIAQPRWLSGGPAVWAHLAGLACGLALAGLMRRAVQPGRRAPV
jgi:membrane associated rhomboid family serine protease